MGYGLGCVPASSLVARRHGVDLRRTSDGNPGAWNALEQLGGRRALPAFLGDGAKGLLAGVIGWLLGDWWTAWAAVGGAMLGHAFPLPHPRSGGKAVMTFVGGAFALGTVAALACGAVCLLLAKLRSFAVGARVGVFLFPLVLLVTDPVEHVAAVGGLMTLIGLLFLLRRRSRAPASDASGAAPSG